MPGKLKTLARLSVVAGLASTVGLLATSLPSYAASGTGVTISPTNFAPLPSAPTTNTSGPTNIVASGNGKVTATVTTPGTPGTPASPGNMGNPGTTKQTKSGVPGIVEPGGITWVEHTVPGGTSYIVEWVGNAGNIPTAKTYLTSLTTGPVSCGVGVVGPSFCDVQFTYHKTPPAPRHQYDPLPPTQGASTTESAMVDFVPPVPTGIQTIPNPVTDTQNPYAFVNYPTQVSLLGNFPTQTATDSASKSGSIFVAKTKTTPAHTDTFTITVTWYGVLQGFVWNTSNASTNSETCAPGQNTLSNTNNDNIPNAAICTIDWQQANLYPGWQLSGYAYYDVYYSAVEATSWEGTFTIVSNAFYGTVDTQAASTNEPVNILQSVTCSSSYC